ncbi:MAG TPA: tetratricopeptide repeat protein, partial [Pyrinomonadaceae bacterium]
MKPKSKSLVVLLSIALISTIVPGNSLLRGASAATETPHTSIEPAQQDAQAANALKQGRILLQRGHSDQALVNLQNALNLFKAANNAKGVAAANDALGDLYVRQGQYAVAVKYYQDAHDAFLQAVSKQGALETSFGMPDNEFNANLMLAKIGDTNYRMGKLAEASSAYGQMKVEKPDPSK